jgi:gliding motility-associated-like protein
VYIAQTRKELHVVVAGCTVVEAILPPKIVSCDDFSVNFENGSQSPKIRTYHWDFGVPNSNTDTSTVANPTYVYPDTGTFTAKLVVNKFENCSDSATTTVIVYPGFRPGFTIFGSCVTNPFSFDDTTRSRYGRVNKWEWDFGEPSVNNDVSSSPNPSYLYPATGTKTVMLTVSDDKGCEAKAEKTFEVLQKPLLNLAFKDTLICSVDTLQLRAGGSGTFLWTPDFRITNRNTATPSVYPQDTITYYVTVTDNGCVNTDSVRINVLDSISVDAGPDLTICRTDEVTLSATSYGLQYQWSPAATLDNSQKKFPIATPLAQQTTYNVTAILGGCTAQDSVNVKTVPYPQANAGPDTTLCFNTSGTLRGIMIASSFNWSPRNLVTTTNSLVTGVRPIVSTNFILTVFDTLGCPKPGRDTVLVRVLPKLNVFAGNDTAVIIGQPLQFGLPEVPPATKYRWSPTIAISSADSLNPTFLFTSTTPLPEGDSLRYRLTATTAIGCTGSDDVLVRVFKTGPSIFVPNGFTPNGDGNNDVIKPILVGMKQLNYFRIYNRPGQVVYSSTSQTDGWDGKIKGNLQGNAAYVYHVQAVDYTGKVVNQSGTILLIR